MEDGNANQGAPPAPPEPAPVAPKDPAPVGVSQAEHDAALARAAAAERQLAATREFGKALGTLDADVLGAFDARYEGLPAEGRPTREAWVAGLKAAPDAAPALLRPWLAAPASAPPPPPAAPPPPPPRAVGGAGGPPAVGSELTDADVRRMRMEAQRTGDWSAYREARKLLVPSVAARRS